MATVIAPPTGRRTTELDATAALADLLDAAASLPLCDPRWSALTSDARSVTVGLARDGALPRPLVVGPCDAPALVARGLAAAWRHVSSHPRTTVRFELV